MKTILTDLLDQKSNEESLIKSCNKLKEFIRIRDNRIEIADDSIKKMQNEYKDKVDRYLHNLDQ